MGRQWYGSLNNRMMENTLQPIPTVEMGATVSGYSDRHPYTITGISEKTITITQNVQGNEITRTYPRKITAIQDEFKVISGSMHDGSAKYEFSPGKKESEETYIFHKKSGLYKKEGTKWIVDKTITREVAREKGLMYHGGYYAPSNRTKQDNQTIILGTKQKYYDPSF